MDTSADSKDNSLASAAATEEAVMAALPPVAAAWGEVGGAGDVRAGV